MTRTDREGHRLWNNMDPPTRLPEGADLGNPDDVGKSHDVAARLPDPPGRDTGPERDFVPCPTMEGYLRVHPEILTDDTDPAVIAELKELVRRIRAGEEEGILYPFGSGYEWVPFQRQPLPRADRAPHGTGIFAAALLGALFWAALLTLYWLARSLIGGGT